jgi:hypothetical protein
MAIVNRMELGRELFRTSVLINAQIEEIKTKAKDGGFEATKMRNVDGTYTMIPLLAAKAQVLHALAIINQRDV